MAEFDRGNFDEAYALFRQAHELAPSARTYRAIGVVSFELRHYVECVTMLGAALEDARKPLTARQRSDATALQKRARAFVAELRPVLTPPGAELLVDDHPAQLTDGLLLLDPGEHKLVARAEGYPDVRRTLRAVAGTHEALSIKLENDTVVNATARRGEEPGNSRHGAVSLPWTWSLAAASVALGATGLGLGMVTKNKHGALDEACGRSARACEDSSAQGERLQRAANATLASAGALLAGAVVSYFLETRHGKADRRRAMLIPTHEGVLVQGSF